MGDAVTVARRGAVAVVRIDNSAVNAWSQAMCGDLHAAFDAIDNDTSVRAVILHSLGRPSAADGDKIEACHPDFERNGLNEVFNRIERLDRPVLAVLDGSAFCAGLELALAAHYRMAHPDTKIGLPDVMFGLPPGNGGTQRLPRLAGVETALDMILSGKSVSALEAVTMGIIDAVAEDSLLDDAVAYAEQMIASDAPPRPTSARAAPVSAATSDVLAARLREARAKYAGPAPQRIIRCVEAAATLPFLEGMALEAKLFEECRLSPEAAALRHLFDAERQTVCLPNMPAAAAARGISRIGVAGAGTMGTGIVMNFLNAGIPAVIVDTSTPALDRGVGLITQTYAAAAARGRLSPQEMEQRLGQLKASLNFEDLAECDLVIEAVFENLDIKLAVCRELGGLCKPGAIIASNTSTLNIDVLAAASGRPAQFLGMHFFSPANVMRLLEVVRGAETAPDVLDCVMELATKIGKIPVVSGVCYGFIGNRMLETYMREADFLLMEGATPHQIDSAIQSLGFAMGPCRMLDLAGLDVAAKVVLEHKKSGQLVDDPSYRAPVQKMFECGRFGQKSGAGYYRYDGRSARPDPETDAICTALAVQNNIMRRHDISDEEIIERCLYPVINEGAKILAEGIAYRSGDIDVVWVNGYGFPRYRGGPMHMAGVLGTAHIMARLFHYGQVRGHDFGYWSIAPLLAEKAVTGANFS